MIDSLVMNYFEPWKLIVCNSLGFFDVSVSLCDSIAAITAILCDSSVLLSIGATTGAGGTGVKTSHQVDVDLSRL